VKETKIALVAVYLGSLPWYWQYFIHSCLHNPSVDFFIISDDASLPKQISSNIFIIHKNLSELNQTATEILGFNVSIKSPYKLCDFKPAYGLLFSTMLRNYEFWGHIDIDLIFGNIRNFLTEEILTKHDLICVRHDFLTGYFLVFKNDDKMNKLFTWSNDYKKVFQDDKHYCFDETNFQFDAFASGKTYNEINSEVESMMHVVKKMEKENYIKPFFDFMVVEGVPGKLKWEKGSLYYHGKYEILLYHMIHFKKKYSPKTPPKTIPETFTISKRKIYHK
jgi:hypothetical protein